MGRAEPAFDCACYADEVRNACYVQRLIVGGDLPEDC